MQWDTRDGTPGSVVAAVRDLPAGTLGDFPVQIPGTADRPALRLRLAALRKAPGAAERARQQARQPGHPPTAATYVLVLPSARDRRRRR